MKKLRIFVSSPSDVNEERGIARRVIERLQYEFRGRVALEPIIWEDVAFAATADFQDQIPHPSKAADICVFILWSRIGTPLREEHLTAGGQRCVTGTELEFIDALTGYQQRGSPDLLVYRKTADRSVSLRMGKQAVDDVAQFEKVEAFFDKYFRDPQGSFTAAFNKFETSAEFEQKLERHLRDRIVLHLDRLPGPAVTQTSQPLWQAGSPFRGLESFQFEHALIYCGRTQAVSDVLNTLRAQRPEGCAFSLLLGMSGVGKSSLVRAGVLPMLAQPYVIEGIDLWRHCIIQPSDARPDLFQGLATAILRNDSVPEISTLGVSVEELAEHLRHSPQAVIPIIRAALGQAGGKLGEFENRKAWLALIVDQFEEVFNLDRVTSDERDSFASTLATLARSECVWVITTCRSDFYPQLAQLPESFNALRKGAGQYEVLPPTVAEVRQIICQPTRIAGLRLEEEPDTGRQLEDVLLNAGVSEPGALPLLEFTLNELYKRRSKTGVLTFAAYHQVGGLEGALRAHAESVFASLSPEQKTAFEKVLSQVVSVGLEDKAVVARKKAPLSVLARTPSNQGLIAKFLAERLLVSDTTDDGTAYIGLAHEALLQHWPRLKQWVAENQDFLRTRARIAAAAALWREEGRTAGFLLHEKKALMGANKLANERNDELAPEELEYIESSLTEARGNRRVRIYYRLATFVTLVFLAAVGLVYWDFNHREHVEYFVAATTRWGLPVGITRLTPDEVSHRAVSLKFTRKGRYSSVNRIQLVNGRNQCPTADQSILFLNSDFIEFGDVSVPAVFKQSRKCLITFDYDRDTHLRSQNVFNQHEDLLQEVEFLRPDLAVYKGETTPIRFAVSGAAFLQFTRPQEGAYTGLNKIIQFVDAAGDLQPDANGEYGYVVDRFNEHGLPTRIFELDSDGNTDREEGRTDILYDEFGNLIELAYYDEDGKLLLHPEGFAKLHVKYDEFGNAIELAYYGEEGELLLQSEGFAKLTIKYDEFGSAIELAYYGEDGKLTLQSGGFAKLNIKYDELGYPLELAYYGEVGMPVRLEDSYHRLAKNYDSRGNLTEITFFDESGQPIRVSFGRFLDVHGEGNEILSYLRDSTGLTGFVSEDIGALSNRLETVFISKLQGKYDDQNRLKEMVFVDAQGDTVMAYIFNYNEGGR